MIELGKEGLNWLLVLVAILFAYFGVIRPLLRTVVPPKSKAEKKAAGEGEGRGRRRGRGRRARHAVGRGRRGARARPSRSGSSVPACDAQRSEDGRQPDQGLDGRE
jgi:hypothetical protein